jgi:hypothetical protein
MTKTKSPLVLTLLVVLFMTTNCMSTKVIAKYDSDSIQPHAATKYTLFWGLLQSQDVPAECPSKCICKVSAETNIGFILLSAVTLGIVVPQRVVWECCGPTINIETTN